MTDARDTPALLDAAGRIRIDAVNQLAMADMARWVADVLIGDRAVTGADRDESPVDLLVRVYHRMDPWVREVFHDVVLGALAELARGSGAAGARWDGAAGEHLLLLVASVVPGAPRMIAQAAIDLLRAIASAEPAAGSRIPVLALKALIALDHRAPPEFWLAQHERWGAPAAGPVLRGMVHWDLGMAFRWIADHARDAAIGAALRAALPLLVDRLGRGPIVDQLAQLAPRLPGDARAALADTCRALRLGDLEAWARGAAGRVALAAAAAPLPDDAAPARTRYLADPRLLHDARLSALSDPAELRARLAADLRAIDPAEEPPGYVRALLLLANALLDPGELRGAAGRLYAWCAGDAPASDAKREALIATLEELDRVRTTSEISFELQACVYLLRNRQRNVRLELERFTAELDT